MKFIIEKDILLDKLTNVMRAVNPRNIIPILDGVKFDLKKEGLYLTASDSDLMIQSFIDKKEIKKIEKTGTIIIQAKYLLDIIRKLPNEDINIEVIDSLKILISTKNTVFNLNCLNLDEYPNINFEETKNPLILKGNILKEIINQTIYAVSTQEARPILTGVNIKVEDNVLNCIATDSYRMSKKTIKLDKSYDSIEVVIPGKNLNEFDKLLTNDNNVEIHLFTNKVLFKYDDYLFQSNLLSGSFPNTQSLVPSEFKFILNATLNSFREAIDRAALLTQSKDRNIVKLETTESGVLISSYASEIGKVEENVLLDKNTDESLVISFSSKYMLEALRNLNEEEILILINSECSLITIKSVKDESLIQVVLPIRTY